jgi:hypothetical protein
MFTFRWDLEIFLDFNSLFVSLEYCQKGSFESIFNQIVWNDWINIVLNFLEVLNNSLYLKNH